MKCYVYLIGEGNPFWASGSIVATAASAHNGLAYQHKGTFEVSSKFWPFAGVMPSGGTKLFKDWDAVAAALEADSFIAARQVKR